MTEHIVVTGGTGFLGKHLCAQLAQDGWDTTAITIEDVELPCVETRKVDILDPDAIAPIIESADVVVHLAAITEHDTMLNRPFETLELNYAGTRNVLKPFVEGKGRHFIYPSTGKVYGKPDYLPYDEEHPTKPSTILGKSKLITERLIDFYSLFSHKAFSVLRIFNVYGPEQKGTFLIPTILNQLASPEIVLGDLHTTRDYIYIDDLIEAFITVIGNPKQGMSVYNVGTGKSYSPADIVRLIEEIEGLQHKLVSDPSKLRKDEFDDERANTAKLEELGWKAGTDMKTGLMKILETMRTV